MGAINGKVFGGALATLLFMTMNLVRETQIVLGQKKTSMGRGEWHSVSPDTGNGNEA